MAESNQQVSQKRFTNSATDLPLDNVFEVLADQRRRNLLRYLLECDPPATVTEMADALLADAGTEEVEERRNLRISLHHVHLPKLDETGFVDYDAETNRVVGRNGIDQIAPYLDITETLER
ncbi:hypothetical protein [Halostella sp. PRR32]|uniref:DUF7344 domain-containing protein n=1 Tax=Halostella sp. PRR32 TaxID=3098147 RepID=UPI002B1E07DA|nr:hypothetical protein [Halostella sp. PRR32]